MPATDIRVRYKPANAVCLHFDLRRRVTAGYEPKGQPCAKDESYTSDVNQSVPQKSLSRIVTHELHFG